MVFPKPTSQPLLFWLSLVRFWFASNRSQILNRMEYLPKQLLWPQPWVQTQCHPVHSHRLPILGFLPKQGGERGERGDEEKAKRRVADLGKCFSFTPSAPNCCVCSECYTWSISTAVVPECFYGPLGTGLAQHTGKEQQPESMSVLNGQTCDQRRTQKTASCSRACLKETKSCLFDQLK